MKNLKIKLSIIFLSASSLLSAQILDLYPKKYVNLNFSKERIKEYNSPAAFLKCSELEKKISLEGRSLDNLTITEEEIFANCNETTDFWETVGVGCNWYCGMSPKKIEGSSFLMSQGGNTYEAKNAHDFSYKTAWAEGVYGYGIGEYLIYTFDTKNPRINIIKVVNGYVKNLDAWKNNSRVKQLKMYVNNELFAFLNLKDEYSEQHFYIPAIGGTWKYDWTIKFEIMQVYKGSKYDDVVITEIYFDGLDVH